MQPDELVKYSTSQPRAIPMNVSGYQDLGTNPDLSLMSQMRTLIGILLYIATHTRPDISFWFSVKIHCYSYKTDCSCSSKRTEIFKIYSWSKIDILVIK